MDAPQRLALLVVADAVEVEADRPPQQKPPAVLGAGAAVEEEPLELDEARVDDERPPLLERQPRLRETERVGDRQPDRLEAVASSRHVVEAVGAPVPAPAVRHQLDVPFAEPTDALVGDDARAAVSPARARARSAPRRRRSPAGRPSARRRPPAASAGSACGCRSVIRTHATASGTTRTSPAATGIERAASRTRRR